MNGPLGVRWRDALLPAGIAVAGVLELVLLQTGTWQIAAVIEVAACGLLVWRRRWPLVTCVIAPLALFTIPWLGGRLDDASVPIAALVLASYALGRYPRTVQRGLVGVGLVAVGIGLTYAVADPRLHSWGDVVFLCGLFLPPFVLGRVVARMAAQKALLIEQQAWIEREAATGERVRIARELHDVLAHSISAMVVQCEVAHDLVRTDPDGALAALDAVAAAGRAALDETGRVLHTLRDEDRASGPATTRAPARAPAPAPGLAGVPQLIDDVRARGLHVDSQLTARHTASAVVDVSAYRIVQEALTNALRHGDGSATFRIAEEAGTLTIHVSNGVGARRRPGSGLGLTGMAERVLLCGGQIRHGIGPDGRFRVDVELPLAAAPQLDTPPAIGARS
ncbi:MAG: histidine kinase [Dermatophilaceae bacterium]